MSELKDNLDADYLDKHVPDIDGVTLRELIIWHSYTTSSGCTIEHSHRWVVHGFFRRQRRDTQYEHHVWVRPHLRGPVGKPIKGL